MRRVAPAALILLVVGCTPALTREHPTGDDGWGPSANERPRAQVVEPRALPIPEAQRTRWSGADALASLTEVAARSPSEHLDGVFDRTVLVSPTLAYGALTAHTIVAPGTIVVQRHHPRGDERTVAYFVMEKVTPAALGWRFLVVDEKLRVAAHENLELCTRCHADAPFGGLFGVPAEPIDTP